jgi:asparagine synthase (glutamine-hydrolysing)
VCGILGYTKGIFSDRNPSTLQSVLAHRGPDGFATYADDFLSLAHWRLAVIDLSPQAAQPFYYENLVLIYNGELYNFREVGAILRQEGYTLETQSDTEVLIKAFHRWGIAAVSKFTGMFAFVVYDKVRREVWLFRDRLGVKPLYYSLQGGLSFGSEMKVFKSLQRPLHMDRLAQRQFFRFGYSPGERTIFREVKKIPPGHYLHYADNTATLHRYWTFPAHQPTAKFPPAEHREELEEALSRAFTYRLVSDVPVGVFLSGGIDSSLVATILQRKSLRPLKTFTIGFDEPKFDETRYAREVSSRLGTDHTEFRLHREDALERMRHFYEVYDEPFSDASGIPTALVASLARQQGIKVVLSADGGDELFGGYPHYQTLDLFRRMMIKLPPLIRAAAGHMLQGVYRFGEPFHRGNVRHRLSALAERLVSRGTLSLFEASVANQTHDEIDALLGESGGFPSLLQENMKLDPVEAMMMWDRQFYLPDDLLLKVDRATMWAGVEARDPFLDHHLIELVQRLPVNLKLDKRVSKVILRDILRKYHPDSLFDRPKQGFSIPLFSWFREEMDSLFDDYLKEPDLDAVGIRPKTVREEWARYTWGKRHGKDYNMEKMWRLLSFMMWNRRWGS